MARKLSRERSLTSASLLCLLASNALVGCGGGEPANTDVGNEMENTAKIVDNIPPEAVVQGDFDPQVRVYGYIVEAKSGAKVTVDLSAAPGMGAAVASGNTLDTIFKVNGPFESTQQPGPSLVVSEDASSSPAAPPATFVAEQDGKYFVSFSTWDNPGKGKYTLRLTCEGTDFQCRRPSKNLPCNANAGTLYIQGGTTGENVTWDACEVVLLEPVTVPTGATLTIKPGVTVRGNYLQRPPNSGIPPVTNNFGIVRLVIDGKLQAAGTEAAPIAFTSFVENRGWGGVLLNGHNHTLEHVFIERADVALDVGANKVTATVADTVIEGMPGSGENVAPESVIGVRALATDTEVTFLRSVVKGFQRGIRVGNAEKFVVKDSVIKENVIGVHIDGAAPVTACPQAPMATPTRYRCPSFEHSDIVNNRNAGIVVNGSDILLEVSSSNVIDNGHSLISVGGFSLQSGTGGVIVFGSRLDPASFITGNNIYDNGTDNAADVRSYHVAGNLNISGNYWKAVSDPELSENWAMCASSQFTFTGFSPTGIADAGPRKADLSDAVAGECFGANAN